MRQRDHGTTQDALELCKARWAQLYDFDLEESVWIALTTNYCPGDCLMAIKLTASTKDRQPEILYKNLMDCVIRLDKQRNERAALKTWPPPAKLPSYF